jgi:hypothetical protein
MDRVKDDKRVKLAAEQAEKKPESVDVTVE